MPKIVMVDALFPNPLFGAGFPRASQILNFLANQDNTEIHFLALWEKGSIGRKKFLSLLPSNVQTTFNVNERNIEKVLINKLKYADILWVSRLPIYKRIMSIREKYPDSFSHLKIIYDSECIETLRAQLQSEISGSLIPDSEYEKLLQDEMTLALQADHVIAVSTSEQEVFLNHGCASAFVVGHKVNATQELKPSEGRVGLLFVGRLWDEGSPNIDSINWFAEKCYPRLQREDLVFHLVGAITKSLSKKFRRAGFKVSGQIEDLQPVFDSAQLFVAPTRFAAGIPIKLLDAAAAGLPIIATRLLCKQLGWDEDRDILVADTEEEFVNKIEMAMSDEVVWYSLQQNAHARVQQEYSDFAFQKSIKSTFALLCGGDEEI